MSRGGLLVRGLENAASDLILLDRPKERAEIALAKTLIALALNELEEDWTNQIRGEDLEQDLGHLSSLFSYRNRALSVYEDAVTLEPCEVLSMARYALVDALVVSGRWDGMKASPSARNASIVRKMSRQPQATCWMPSPL
jgi:hypothetical protein